MNRFKGIVKLSQAQYDTLKEQGSITIKGKTFLYDPTNTIYVTKDSGVTANKVTSVNGETGDITLTSESVNAVSKSVDTLIGSPNTISNTEDGISISGNKVNIGGTTDLAGSEVIGTQITSDNIQVRTSGSTQNYTPKIIDISSGEIAITGFDLTLDGKQVATLEDIQNGSSNGITELVGTEDVPINLYSDLEVGKLYFLKGYVLVGESYGSRDFSTNNVLVYKQDIDSVKVNAWVSRAMGPYFSQGSETNITVDETGYWTSVSTSVGVKSVNNSTSVYPIDLYSPTTAGTEGQVLTSNGSGAPTWSDLPTGGIEQLVGTEDKPINFATDMEVGHLYNLNGYIFMDNTTSGDSYPIKNAMVHKRTETELIAYNHRISKYTAQYEFGVFYKVTFDKETGVITATDYMSIIHKVNGSQQQKSTIYAPTSGGTKGQILQSNGSGEPTWVDMPEIPSIEGLATEEYVNNAIGSLTSINFTPVTGLPTENISTTTIYLLPIEGDTNNTYEEYIYVNDTWEKIGTTSVDLSGYATTAQLEEVTNTTSTALQPEDAATTSDIDSLFELVDNDNPSLPEEGRE